MSKLGRKLVADKLTAAGKAARRDGSPLMAATLNYLAVIHLVGNERAVEYVFAAAKSVAEVAEGFEGGPRGDRVSDSIHQSSQAAHLAGENYVAAILGFVESLRMSGRIDLILKLCDVAQSYSDGAVGKKPEKAVMIVDNDIGPVGGRMT